MGLDEVFEFDLVPPDPSATIATTNWPTIQHRLLHMQPAESAVLIGEPPTAIRVRGFGGTEVAPAILTELAEFAGTDVRIVPQAR